MEVWWLVWRFVAAAAPAGQENNGVARTRIPRNEEIRGEGVASRWWRGLAVQLGL